MKKCEGLPPAKHHIHRARSGRLVNDREGGREVAGKITPVPRQPSARQNCPHVPYAPSQYPKTRHLSILILTRRNVLRFGG